VFRDFSIDWRCLSLGSTSAKSAAMAFVPASVAAAALLCLSLQHAHAQTANAPQPIIEEGLRRQEERAKDQQKQLEPKADVLQPSTVKLQNLEVPKEDVCFVINEVVLTGKDWDRFAWLDSATMPFLRKCIGVKGLSLLASAIDNQLIDQGYVTSKASISEQNLKQGKLSINLHVGRIADIRMVSKADAKAKEEPDTQWGTWRNAFPTSKGSVLNIRDIEQGVEQMKRIPSQQVTTRLEPGDQPDTSVVIIERAPASITERVRGGITLDNSGGKALGRTQMSANLSLDNFFALNDIATFSYNTNAEHPTQEHVSKSLNFNYSIPWGYHTFSASRSASKFSQIVQGTTARFLSTGGSQSTELKWGYGAYRSSSAKLGVFAALSARKSNSFIDDTELIVQRRRTTQFETGVNYKYLFEQSSLDSEVSYRRGMPWHRAEDDYPSAQDGGFTLRPKVWALNANYNTSWKIGSSNEDKSNQSTSAPQTIRYSASLRGQYAKRKNPSSDQISIGSRGSVRGFDGESVLAAENGWSLRNELSTNAPQVLGIDTAIYMALDIGRVWGPSDINLIGHKLAGMALGVRSQWKQLQLDFSLGSPLYQPEGFKTKHVNPYITLTYAF
jgi:hemolysin activation/secretion protein